MKKTQAKTGLNVSYLVRSKKFKAPRNWPRNSETCLKQLEMLKEVELLQNVQVQKSLKSLMEELNIDKRNAIGQLHSARDFQKKVQKEKCHNNVEKIIQQNKDNVQTTKGNNETKKVFTKKPPNFSHAANVSRFDVEDISVEDEQRKETNDCTDIRCNFSSKSFASKQTKLGQTLKLPSLVEPMSTGLTSQESKTVIHSPHGQLNTLPKLDVKPNVRACKSRFNYSMPVLDSKSKFSIIRMARTLRQNRRKFMEEESQAWKPIEHTTRNKPVKEEKFDLFADNYELLSPRYLASRGEKKEPMHFLDNKSFDVIDCDDFLQLENRIVLLSPLPAVVTNKEYTKPLTKLELRRGFR